MAYLRVMGRGKDYIRVRVEGLQNPASSYETVHFEVLGTSMKSGEWKNRSGAGQNSEGYYTAEWTTGILQPSTTYTIRGWVETAFQPYFYDATATTLESPDPPPTPSKPSVSGQALSSTSIRIDWSGSADYYTLEYRRYNTGASWIRLATDITTHSYTQNYLSAGIAYEFSVQAKNCNNYGCTSSDRSTIVVVTDRERPSNFYWTYSKTSGGNFYVTATEWNNLTDRISEFLAYKGFASRNFIQAISGDDFRSAMFNQAVDSISDMNPSVSPPSRKWSGDDIYASYLNELVTSLNSIS